MPVDELAPPSPACPIEPGRCQWTFAWPEGYQDPPWQPTGNPFIDEPTFSAVVLTKRREVLVEVLNDHLLHHGILNVQFTWEPAT